MTEPTPAVGPADPADASGKFDPAADLTAQPPHDPSQLTATHRLAAEVAYRAELARIDAEWEAERRRYVRFDGRGRDRDPSPSREVLVGAAAAAVGAVGTAVVGPLLGQVSWAGLAPVAGLVLVGFGAWVAVRAPARAAAYKAALDAYHRRRATAAVDPAGGRRTGLSGWPRRRSGPRSAG